MELIIKMCSVFAVTRQKRSGFIASGRDNAKTKSRQRQKFFPDGTCGRGPGYVSQISSWTSNILLSISPGSCSADTSARRTQRRGLLSALLPYYLVLTVGALLLSSFLSRGGATCSATAVRVHAGAPADRIIKIPVRKKCLPADRSTRDTLLPEEIEDDEGKVLVGDEAALLCLLRLLLHETGLDAGSLFANPLSGSFASWRMVSSASALNLLQKYYTAQVDAAASDLAVAQHEWHYFEKINQNLRGVESSSRAILAQEISRSASYASTEDHGVESTNAVTAEADLNPGLALPTPKITVMEGSTAADEPSLAKVGDQHVENRIFSPGIRCRKDRSAGGGSDSQPAPSCLPSSHIHLSGNNHREDRSMKSSNKRLLVSATHAPPQLASSDASSPTSPPTCPEDDISTGVGSGMSSIGTSSSFGSDLNYMDLTGATPTHSPIPTYYMPEIKYFPSISDPVPEGEGASPRAVVVFDSLQLPPQEGMLCDNLDDATPSPRTEERQHDTCCSSRGCCLSSHDQGTLRTTWSDLFAEAPTFLRLGRGAFCNRRCKKRKKDKFIFLCARDQRMSHEPCSGGPASNEQLDDAEAEVTKEPQRLLSAVDRQALRKALWCASPAGEQARRRWRDAESASRRRDTHDCVHAFRVAQLEWDRFALIRERVVLAQNSHLKPEPQHEPPPYMFLSTERDHEISDSDSEHLQLRQQIQDSRVSNKRNKSPSCSTTRRIRTEDLQLDPETTNSENATSIWRDRVLQLSLELEALRNHNRSACTLQ
ncbi:unnamed protein product [Amoebophrya sp. A120]|nr:unnamed protein product [Amoebophrya sp. A120]|eukprot:GSA120T00001931001.1